MCDLGDLPLELFRQVLDETVSAVGATEAVRLRLISKIFDQEIEGAVARTCQLQEDAVSNTRGYYNRHFPVRYIAKRALIERSTKKNLSSRLHRILETVLQYEACSEDQYHEYLIILVDAVVEHHGIKKTLRFLDEKENSDLLRYTIIDDAVNAAALLGISSKFDEIKNKTIDNETREFQSRSDHTALIDSPIVLAAFGGQLMMLSIILDAREACGSLPIHKTEIFHAVWCATSRGHESIVRLLLKPKYGYIDFPFTTGLPKLAAAHGNPSLLRFICERGKVKIGHFDIRIAAAFHGHQNLVEISLAGRGDVNRTVNGAFAPTMLAAAASGGHAHIVRLLLSRDAHSVDWDHSSQPIGYAVRAGHLKIVKILFEAGGRDHHTLIRELPQAACNGHAHIVQFILDEASDMRGNAKYEDMRAYALRDAAARGFESIVRLLVDRETVGKNAGTLWCESPMLAAMKYGHPHIVKTLLELGVKEIDPFRSVYASKFIGGEYPCDLGLGVKPVLRKFISPEPAGQ